jgi:hypothetical protein
MESPMISSAFFPEAFGVSQVGQRAGMKRAQFGVDKQSCGVVASHGFAAH